MSEYTDKIKGMNWSYSRLSSYYTCPYQFYLNYILKDRETYPPENNFWAQNGSLVHHILEEIFKGNLSVDDASEYYCEHFDDEVYDKPKNSSTINKKYELCCDYLVNVDFDWLKDYEILGIEKEVTTKFADCDYHGYIDLLLRDKNDGGIIILDHKSSEYPMCANGLKPQKHHAEQFEGYKRQLYTYAKGVFEEYGEYPKELWWNYFSDPKHRYVKIPFKMKEYEETIKWFEDGIELVANEDDFPAFYSYFFCANICSFKNCCEYALTEREEARKKMWSKGKKKKK